MYLFDEVEYPVAGVEQHERYREDDPRVFVDDVDVFDFRH